MCFKIPFQYVGILPKKLLVFPMEYVGGDLGISLYDFCELKITPMMGGPTRWKQGGECLHGPLAMLFLQTASSMGMKKPCIATHTQPGLELFGTAPSPTAAACVAFTVSTPQLALKLHPGFSLSPPTSASSGSDIMRADYIPSHAQCQHRTILPAHAPITRPVMRQMKRVSGTRTARASPATSTSTPTPTTSRRTWYSQPEMRRRGTRIPISLRAPGPREQTGQPAGPAQLHESHGAKAWGPSAISHTVSTPGAGQHAAAGPHSYNAAHVLKTISSGRRLYPRPRPATSTPDLASHRHKYAQRQQPRPGDWARFSWPCEDLPGGQLSSGAPVPPGGEKPLTATKHHGAVHKRHSLEAMSSMVRGMQAMTLKSPTSPRPGRNTLRSRASPRRAPGSHEVPQLPVPPQEDSLGCHHADSQQRERGGGGRRGPHPVPQCGDPRGSRRRWSTAPSYRAAGPDPKQAPTRSTPGPGKREQRGAAAGPGVLLSCCGPARLLHGPAKAISVSPG